MSSESQGISKDQGLRKVKVVGAASEKNGLPGGDRKALMVEVLSKRILHQCPGTQGTGYSRYAGLIWAWSYVLQPCLDLLGCVS